jgi:hypothetical protein
MTEIEPLLNQLGAGLESVFGERGTQRRAWPASLAKAIAELEKQTMGAARCNGAEEPGQRQRVPCAGVRKAAPTDGARIDRATRHRR